MAPETFADLIGAIRHSFLVLPAAGIAVEIDPRTLTDAMVDAFNLWRRQSGEPRCAEHDPIVRRAIHQVFKVSDQTAAARQQICDAPVHPRRQF